MRRWGACGLFVGVLMWGSASASLLASRAWAQNAAGNSLLNVPTNNGVNANLANNAAKSNAARNNAAHANAANANAAQVANAAANPGPEPNFQNNGTRQNAAPAASAPPATAPVASAPVAAPPPDPVDAIPSELPPAVPGISEPLGVSPREVAPDSGSAPTRMAAAEQARVKIADPEIARYEEQISVELRQKLKRDLDVYCMDYCTVLSLETDAEEVYEASQADLGFEGAATGPGESRRFRVRKSQAEILIDTRFGSENITRIQRLFERLTPRYEKPMLLTWTRITFPETAATQKSEAEVRNEFASQVKHQIERTIAQFCPVECKLNALDVQVSRASMDEAERGAVQRFLFSRDGRGAIFVRGVQAGLSISSAMDPTRRAQIASVIRESLLPFGSVSLDITSVAFPRPADELQKDQDDARRDPYGLEKMAALMKLFRENMVGKEVYKETNTRESSNQATTEAKERTQTSNSVSRENESSTEKAKEGTHETNQSPWLVAGIIGLVLLVLGVIAALWIRSFLNGQAMKSVLAEGTLGRPLPPEGESGEKSDNPPASSAATLHSRMEVHNLQDEILQMFVASPKASRDVFTRILREDGIDKAAKYVSIFGEIVVYELLRDLDLRDDLNTLAEYVHQNAPQVKNDEKLELLRQLKLKLTAAKVKLLANRTMDIFDFLKAWSPRQIYELARDEVASVQGIILTQLSPEKRRGVFELFNEEAKTKLLQALSQIDMMPREYLIGTAQFLKQKAQKNPIFDAENVRGTEVLMDLLAKADAPQQRALVAQLDATNPQAAWLVRNSLVTPETLLFMKESALIDMFLDMDPQDMATFLAGSSDHIRNGVFARVPREISANWAENMPRGTKVEAEAYRMAEAKVFSRVRQWASKGGLNLAEINDKVYPRVRGGAGGPEIARRGNNVA